MDGRAAPEPGTGTRVAAFFDLDKTIIAGSSTLAFSGPMRARGLIGRRAMLRSGYAQLLLMVAGADADFMERMRRRISALCTGWDAEVVRSVIEEALSEVLTPMIYAEAVELIETHRARGHRVAVVSASGEEMVAPVATLLGAEHCVATRMVVVDGRYTGEIESYCYGEGKAVAARRLAAEHGYRLEDSYAYSDSITDLPLLDAVGHPYAVNPDRELRRVAGERGWPVLDFVAPVTLGVRFGARLRALLPTGLGDRAVPPAGGGRPPAGPGLPSPAGPGVPTPAGVGAVATRAWWPVAGPGARVAGWGVGGLAAAAMLSLAWWSRRRPRQAIPPPRPVAP